MIGDLEADREKLIERSPITHVENVRCPLLVIQGDNDPRAPREAPQPDDPYAAERTTKQWYVIHTYSGYENKVKANLEHRIESMGVEDQIFQVLVPMEEEIEIKNRADSLVYGTERMLRENGDKVPAEDKAAIEAALGDAREALKTDDLDGIKRAEEALQKASHKLAEAMYREQAKSQTPGGAPGAGEAGQAGGHKGDVVDAEFEDLGDKK